MIEQFFVQPCNQYEENTLVPYPDRESRDKLLLFENLMDSKIVYSINVRAGGFVIGFNALKRISSLELGVYRRNWQVLPNGIPRPAQALEGCIEFVNVQTRINDFDELRLAVKTDMSQSAVRIEIGDFDRIHSSWVSLSRYCIAEIVHNYLVGFWLDISDY